MARNPKEKLVVLATQASLFVAILLIALKTYAWLQTDSISFLASLSDSAMDFLASFLNMVAVFYALKPADENHKFGHGKAESLAGLSQALLIAGSSLYLLFLSFERFFHPRAIESTQLGLSISILSLCFTLALVFFQRYVVAQTNSQAIKADSTHYLSDVLANSALIVVMLTSHFQFYLLDPLLGVLIALYLLHSSWEIGEESFNTLLDHELPDEITQDILKIARSNEEVQGIHDLKTRQSGTQYIIQMHLELDKHLSLEKAHSIADEVEEKLVQKYPGADIIIHQDPV